MSDDRETSTEGPSSRPPADSTPALTLDTEPPPAPAAPTGLMAPALGMALLVTAATAGAVSFAFRPEVAGEPVTLGAFGGLYAVLTGVTLLAMRSRGRLKEVVPGRGDISFGAFLAGGLYLAALGLKLGLLEQPPRSAWLSRVYLQLGDPNYTKAFYVGAAILAIAAAEEVAWRGGVQTMLIEALGETRGWLATSALYALAHTPSLFLLSDPQAGPNPLVVLAALGCGLVWGLLAAKTQRLGPSLFSHALFTWAIVEFPLTRF